MEARLKRRVVAVGALTLIALTGGLIVRAQDTSSPPPAGPSEGSTDNTAAGVLSPTPAASSAQPPAAAQPDTATGNSPLPTPPTSNAQASQNTAEPAPDVATEVKKPVEPPRVVRSPVAVLQALDKVTAETMRFAAPVGREVRYKGLLITVKACETRDVDSAQPKASAYLVVTSAPQIAPSGGPPPTKQIFRGWMFAQAPGLDPLEHPIYDAWLIACSAAPPAS